MTDQGSQPNGDADFGLPSFTDRQPAAGQDSQNVPEGVKLRFHPEGATLVPVFADLEGREQVV